MQNNSTIRRRHFGVILLLVALVAAAFALARRTPADGGADRGASLHMSYSELATTPGELMQQSDVVAVVAPAGSETLLRRNESIGADGPSGIVTSIYGTPFTVLKVFKGAVTAGSTVEIIRTETTAPAPSGGESMWRFGFERGRGV